MERTTQQSTDTDTASATAAEEPKSAAQGGHDSQSLSPEAKEAQEKLDQAEQRFLSAAIAFCDGLISEGQLRAVREMLREKELRLGELLGEETAPFVEEERAPTPPRDGQVEPLPDSAPDSSATTDQSGGAGATPVSPSEELRAKLAQLDEKLERLEVDFQQGRINASQYRAIRRHYLEQHEVAMRLHKANPASDRWRVVLEEGKTSFLMQLNEAECRCIAFYDIATRECIYLEGELPDEADEAMRFLSTFGPPPTDQHSGRMFATQTDDGLNLLLIPGRYTAALVAFSDEPPGWQVRALREVVRNFEAANKAPLSRGQRKALVFPNLERFFRD